LVIAPDSGDKMLGLHQCSTFSFQKLISKALTYGRASLLALAALLLSVISRRIESTCGKPAFSFPVVLINFGLLPFYCVAYRLSPDPAHGLVYFLMMLH
jgi:hypothetical protein